MSFHTLTVTKRVTGPEFGYILERICRLSSKNKARFYEIPKKDIKELGCPYNTEITFTTVKRAELLKCRGILIDFINFSEAIGGQVNPLYFGIQIRINPARFFNNEDFITITESTDIEDFITEINTVLKEIAIQFPNFEEFSINRIDFARNVNLGDQEKVEKYMRLIYKAFVPKIFKVKKYDNTNGYKAENNSVGISIYNKKAQMEEQKKYFSSEEIDRAAGVVRFEIQVKYMKAYSIIKNNKYKNIKEFLLDSDKVAKCLFNKYFAIFFFEGDYYSLNRAIDIVNESELSFKVKERMIWILSVSYRCKNINSAINKILENYNLSEYQLKRCISCFNLLGVNLITIPRRYNEEKLVNPLKLIKL